MGIESSVIFCVVVRAIGVFEGAFVALLALSSFINHCMVVMFFPAMGELAGHHIGTAALNVEVEVLVLPPVFALFFSVLDAAFAGQPPAEVLLIMGVHTMQAVMDVYHRTHHGFVLEHEEVCVWLAFVQQFDAEFRLVVHEGTERAENAFGRIVRIGAVASLKTVLVVHLLHHIMRV